MSGTFGFFRPGSADADAVLALVSSRLAASQVTDFIGLSGLKGAFSA